MIPVYNGADYVGKTVRSLLAQSFLSFEIICVNDGSSDDSLSLLEELARADSRVKVYSKPNGGDATRAIMYGLQHAVGRYFMYSSQDDLFSADLLEKSFARIEALQADAVVPDMQFYIDGGDASAAQKIIGVKGDRSAVLSGPEAFVLSLDWTIHGFVLWSMELVRRVGFATYGLSSDEYTTRMFFFHAAKVVFSDGIFYYRQDNPGAITKKWNANQLDYIETCQRLAEFSKQHGFSEDVLATVQRITFGQLVRIQVMFNRNKAALSVAERCAFSRRLRAAFARSTTGGTSGSAWAGNGVVQAIKRTSASNYFLFLAYCKLAQIRQGRAT